MFSKLLVGAALVAVCLGVVLERPSLSPEGKWAEIRSAASTDKIRLGFALKYTNLEKLEELLMAVSTPSNPEYGNHRSAKELKQMVMPTRESVVAVRSWLETEFSSSQIKTTSETEELMMVDTTIEVAQRLLNCEFSVYRSIADPELEVTRLKFGTDYHVDESVTEHLYFVSPTHRFPSALKPTVRKITDPLALRVTPDVIAALYKTNKTVGKSSTNKQGVAAFQNQKFSDADTEQLWTAYDVPSCSLGRVPAAQGTGYGVESELDVQYITSTGRGIAMEHWYTSGGLFNFPNSLLAWSENVLNTADAPPLFSVSYGTTEEYYGINFITQFNTQLMLMGAAGVSVLFASGDSGAGGDCTSPPFLPDYPASSPYVTAVGGVTGGNAKSTPIGESVWSGGGGGFSDAHSQPSYQAAAVADYLNNAPGIPSSKNFNSTGRGYPDISAQSVDFIVYVRGDGEGVSGTSAASPTAAGVFALLNDLRQQNGMSNMGFLNPFIYATAYADSTAFNDCTSGSNEGCSSHGSVGFPAYTGWDPASGWGSPNYEVLSATVLKTGQSTLRWNQLA